MASSGGLGAGNVTAADGRDLGAGEDDRGAHPPVTEVHVVGDPERGLATVRLTAHRDLPPVDQSGETISQVRNDDAHVAWLVDEVGLVRAAGGVRVLKREDRCGNDVAGARPGAQERGVRRRA